MRKNMRLGVVVLFMVCAAGAAPFALSSHKPVRVIFGDERTIRHEFETPCLVSYRRQVTVRPEVVGRITTILVHPGDRIDRGAPLILLDRASAESQLRQATAALDVATWRVKAAEIQANQADSHFGRSRQLLERGITPVATAEDTAIDHQLAHNSLELARAQSSEAAANQQLVATDLLKYTIRAPMDGAVVSVNVAEGETALPSAASIPGSELLTLVALDSGRVELRMPENYYSAVRLGQPVSVDIPGLDQHFETKVTEIGEAIVTGTQVQPGKYFTAYAALPSGTTLDARPSMSCHARVADATVASTLTLPWEAVRGNRGKQGSYVWTMDHGQAMKVAVETGIHDDDAVQIVAGLSRNDAVIIGPDDVVKTLADGDQVRHALQ